MWIFGYGSLVWKVDFPYLKKVIGYIKGYERKFWQASIDHRGVPGKPGRVVTLVPSSDPEAKVWGAAYKIHRADINRVVEHLDLREVMGYEKVPIDFYPISSHPQNVLEPASPLDYDNLTKNVKKSLQISGKILQNENSGLENQVISSSSNHTMQNGNKDKNNRQEEDSSESDNDSNTEDINEGRPFTVIMYYGSSENEHYIGPAPTDSMAKQIFECIGPSGRNKDYLYNLAKAMRQICEEALDPHLAELEYAVQELDIQFNLRSPGTPMEL